MPATTLTPEPDETGILTPLQRIAQYLQFRSIDLDPQEVLKHFEDNSITEDLFSLEGDYDALIDRFDAQVEDFVWPARGWRRESDRVFREALLAVIEHLETGRIDGRAAELDDAGCGCILQILADAIDLHWPLLRVDSDMPLPIEQFLWHVRPRATHLTCVALALVRLWTLRLLGLDAADRRNPAQQNVQKE